MAEPRSEKGDRRRGDRRRSADYVELIKKVERLVDAIDHAEDVAATIRTVANGVISEFREELGIYGGRVYHRQGSSYILEGTVGEARELPSGLRVPASYPPVALLLEKGAVYMERGDSRTDPELEQRLGVETFAAIHVGDAEYLLAFDVAPGYESREIHYSLGILRHAINQRIRHERMADVFREARRIQSSILPQRNPRHGDFDVCGRIVPLESVGGDYFDLIRVSDRILGVAVADVTGHGLPAALQVRDVYTGLRMGLTQEFKIVRTVERLNDIIHESSLTSRFVSMFYGELDLNGVFIYVNAGHPPPFILSDSGEVEELTEGGPVLGPIPNASYDRGYCKLSPGDLLVLYSDGIVEAARDTGEGSEEYGLERLLATLKESRSLRAREIVKAVFDEVDAFGGPGPAGDDRTLVVVRYPALTR